MATHELIDAINEVLIRYNHERDEPGEAIDALEALGYIAGQIFSFAPDRATRRVGHEYFMAAIQAGLDYERVGSTLH